MISTSLRQSCYFISFHILSILILVEVNLEPHSHTSKSLELLKPKFNVDTEPAKRVVLFYLNEDFEKVSKKDIFTFAIVCIVPCIISGNVFHDFER